MINKPGVCPVCGRQVTLKRNADTPEKDAKIEWHGCAGSGHTVDEARRHYAHRGRR